MLCIKQLQSKLKSALRGKNRIAIRDICTISNITYAILPNAIGDKKKPRTFYSIGVVGKGTHDQNTTNKVSTDFVLKNCFFIAEQESYVTYFAKIV